MKKTLLALAAIAFAMGTSAKLPPPDDATKAKAAETAAKAAWQAKADAYQLCKAQDRTAAYVAKHGGNVPAREAPGKAMPVAAKPAASAASGAAAGSTPTPATASAPPPCTDPGPFAYNPPEQKPLETSGAHSPSGTAANPPSVGANSAQMAPAKK
jgi:hypothetical protein